MAGATPAVCQTYWLKLMTLVRSKCFAQITVGFLFGVAHICMTQDNSAAASNWTASSQQQDPHGAVNPIRIRETHTQSDGRELYQKLIETLGPDGRYVPYSETETASVRVDASSVHVIERTFGADLDGRKVLIQERREESRRLPGGELTVVRTTLNQDANGMLQVVRRELQDSRQLGSGERQTKTTVLTSDVDGGLAPAVQIDERRKETSPGAVEFKKSTSLSDGDGHWHFAETREGTRKDGPNDEYSTEELVLRPDSSGRLAIVERTVGKESETEQGEKHGTIETYSIDIPGRAGNDGMQLVERETIRGNVTIGSLGTRRQIERPNPGNPSDDLYVAQETIDIMRPGADGVTEQNLTILVRDPNGRLGEVWIDIGKTENPFSISGSTRARVKP